MEIHTNAFYIFEQTRSAIHICVDNYETFVVQVWHG